MSRRSALGCLLGALVTACADPAVDDVIERLGPEARGVPQGPEHRPGQPCATCHRDGGEGPVFTLAGTVYRDSTQALPLERAIVELVDAEGVRRDFITNCAGNFYIETDDWQPAFPVWVQVRFRDKSIAMLTPIQRERSCASCHFDPAGPGSAGHVYVSDEPFELATTGCE